MITIRNNLILLCISLNVICHADADGMTQRSPKKTYTLDYVKPEHFLADFTNLSCHRDKPIKYWATQLLLFFGQNKELKEFARDLARAVPCRDPIRIGTVFLTYQHCFAPEFRGLIIERHEEDLGGA